MTTLRTFLLSDFDVRELVHAVASGRGLKTHFVVLNDDNDPMPLLAKELGVSEERICEDTVGAAGIIKKHLVVFFPDDAMESRVALATRSRR